MQIHPAWLPVSDIFLVISLVLFGFGLFGRTKHPKIVSAGDFVFGFFWLLQSPVYYLDGSYDAAVFSVLAMAFFGLMGMRQWNAEVFERPLRFPTVAALVGSVLYFPFERIPLLSIIIIRFVAIQSVWWINLFGFNYQLGPSLTYGHSLYYITDFTTSQHVNVPILDGADPTGIYIIVACTGLQVIVLFAGLILASWSSWRKRLIVLFTTIPAIHFLNLFRNGMIIYLVDKKGVSFEVAHGWLGISISLAMIGLLAFWAFIYLDKIHHEILDTLKFVITGKRLEEEKKKDEPSS